MDQEKSPPAPLQKPPYHSAMMPSTSDPNPKFVERRRIYQPNFGFGSLAGGARACRIFLAPRLAASTADKIWTLLRMAAQMGGSALIRMEDEEIALLLTIDGIHSPAQIRRRFDLCQVTVCGTLYLAIEPNERKGFDLLAGVFGPFNQSGDMRCQTTVCVSLWRDAVS